MIEAATALLGAPHARCGRSEEAGLDCWGFVRACLLRAGVDPGDCRTYAIHDDNIELVHRFLSRVCEPLHSSANPGDILVFRRMGVRAEFSSHMGILAPGETFIHVSDQIGRVIRTNLTPTWREALFSAWLVK